MTIIPVTRRTRRTKIHTAFPRSLALLAGGLLLLSLVGRVSAEQRPARVVPVGGDLYADTWVATDALGRIQPDFSETGPARADKFVGIFYWTWHIPRGPGGPHDNTKLIASAQNGHVEWPQPGCPHHWGEPELGYYLMTDPFVIRKHASLLADAGIDVILFDTTNPPFTWKDEYEALCRVYAEMRADGNKTPAIGFICPFGDPMPVLNRVWNDLYKPGQWRDLWFQWDGKPLILADPRHVQDPAMREFFTFRRPMPDYWTGPSGPDQWSWLEVHPQHVFRNAHGVAEQVSVGVAQNALPKTPGPAPMSHARGAMGRSWHQGAKDLRPGAVQQGLNFDEQWRRALDVDPKFIFVTGWNEWVAGRFQQWSSYSDQDAYFPAGLFVDQYNQEYSRDCEPMSGGHTDNYYYQLAAWVRRFKGTRPLPLRRDRPPSWWTGTLPIGKMSCRCTATRLETSCTVIILATGIWCTKTPRAATTSSSLGRLTTPTTSSSSCRHVLTSLPTRTPCGCCCCWTQIKMRRPAGLAMIWWSIPGCSVTRRRLSNGGTMASGKRQVKLPTGSSGIAWS